MTTPKEKMILAALDLLRRSGLTGASINQVVEASGAPMGSLYHYFPRGKLELVGAALEEAEGRIGAAFGRIFDQRMSLEKKVKTLFTTTGRDAEANAFAEGCPVAAVTLDLEHDMERLRELCRRILQIWQRTIAAGLEEVPEEQRLEVAELILITLEGALIVSRAAATKDPLVRAGTQLAEMLALRFQLKPRRKRRPAGRA